MNEMMKKKLSPGLLKMIEQQTIPDPVSVIVQLEAEGQGEARLNDDDRQMIENVGGTILDDLWIIKGFSADVPARALEMIVLSARVSHVHHNSDMTGD
jgi:hypothetical protein